MKKNVMKEIAKQFGLKLGEKFFIEDKGKFLFDDDFGLMKKTGDNVGDVTVVRDDTLRQLLTGQYEVIRLSTPILSNSENEYLSNIINPIRNKVVAIRKLESFNFNYIQIELKQYDFYECIDLPYFEAGTMYKNMELNKEYTIEELGL